MIQRSSVSSKHNNIRIGKEDHNLRASIVFQHDLVENQREAETELEKPA